MRCARSVVLLAMVVMMAGGCPHSKKNDGAGSGSAKTQLTKKVKPMDRGVVVVKAGGRALRVAVEIARTDPQRMRGLMYRKELADNAGMLFVFYRDNNNTFWMKNTYIPLDMLFADAARVVVGIVHSAEPMTLQARGVGKPSRYVLEVNAGWAKRNKVGPGATFTFEGFTP